MLRLKNVDGDKKLIRIAAWWLRKQYAKGKTKDAIHEDMEACGNPVIRKLWKLMDVGGELKEEYQQDIMLDLGELLAWIIANDTAYRDPFFYIIKKMLDMKDEIYDDVLKYYKEPEDWYCNVWHDAKERTKELKVKGDLPDVDHMMSNPETYFVTRIQEKKLREMEAQAKKEKVRRGW